MSRATFLPCSVRHVTNSITLEQSLTLLPVTGCRLIRDDGVMGKIMFHTNSSIDVVWNNGKRATYTNVKYAAIA